jgi:hypothetical protein
MKHLYHIAKNNLKISKNVSNLIIKYFSFKEAQSVPEIKSTTADQFVEIKVKEDARSYIISDVTEKITFDNKSFNLVDSEIVKNYQGLIYYGYYLKEIK